MKRFFLLTLVTATAFAQNVPPETLQRLQKLYPEQSIEFIKERIKNAPTAFNKWRSFPPYYYEMISRSKTFSGRRGLCAGDAHLENFGFIADPKGPVFTVNDLDDVTECSLDADAMRLFVGQRLLNPGMKAETFLAEYQKGLKGQECIRPDFINKLYKDAVKKGQGLSKKNKALLDSKTCAGEYQVLSGAERNMLEDFIKAENGDQSCLKSDVLSKELREIAKTAVNSNPKEILHACSRTKDSGGSAGGKRFIVFRKSSTGVIDAFELKPLAKPAPDFSISVSQDERERKFTKAVETYLNANLKDHYYPVTLNNTLYQRRPAWGGNEAVKDEDILPTEKEAVMLYESCTLGTLHRKSNSQSFVMTADQWSGQAEKIEKLFLKEFGQ